MVVTIVYDVMLLRFVEPSNQDNFVAWAWLLYARKGLSSSRVAHVLMYSTTKSCDFIFVVLVHRWHLVIIL